MFSWPTNYDCCYTLDGVNSREGIGLHSGEKTKVKIAYYEKEGLLPNVIKDSAGRRKYRDDDLQRIGFIKCLKGTGMSLKQIKEYGDLYEQGKAKFKERNAMLEEHREKILQEIKTQKKYLKMVEAKIQMKI